jgi:glycerol-3-phosphate dehydrogenase
MILKGCWAYFFSPQVAVPDVVEAAKEADILVFVVPHQFIKTLCSTLLGKIKPTAVGLSLIKVCSLQLHHG